MNSLFDVVRRTDATPQRWGESKFQFLNRSASTYFGLVRELIEDWLQATSEPARRDLIGAMRKDDPGFESAFWELYLHEGYRRSGYTIEIHPEVPGTRNRPDFRLTHGEESFYLEAVAVGRSKSEVSAENRLHQVQRVLDELRVTTFNVIFTHYAVGTRPLSTRTLRQTLLDWISELDPEEVARAAHSSAAVGFDRLPSLPWIADGWTLEFHAIPRVEAARELEAPAVGLWGPGDATMVDNLSGLRRVLRDKHGRYGALDVPLVIAVQSNTTYPTKDYEVEQALYGIASRRPAESALHPKEIFEDGFWLTRQGWRCSNTPQVIAVYGLAPWLVGRSVPRLWQTLEPGVAFPRQPSWLAPMTIADEARPGPTPLPGTQFGSPEGWPGMEPDFDAR